MLKVAQARMSNPAQSKEECFKKYQVVAGNHGDGRESLRVAWVLYLRKAIHEAFQCCLLSNRETS